MRWVGPFPTSNVASMEMAMLFLIGVLCTALFLKQIAKRRAKDQTALGVWYFLVTF